MLNHVIFSEMPERISFFALPDGTADVFLRKNIRELASEAAEENEAETAARWEADEAYMRCERSLEYIESNFDRTYNEAVLWKPKEPYTPTIEDRIETLEKSGMFGRFGDALFFPFFSVPDWMEDGSLLLSEAPHENVGRQTLVVGCGYSIKLTTVAERGSTEYIIANTFENRILAQSLIGAVVCTNRDSRLDTVRVTSVLLENGANVVAGASLSGGRIVVTTTGSANPYEDTEYLRFYPPRSGFANLFAGAAGSTSSTSGYSISFGQGVLTNGTSSIIGGLAVYNTGNRSAVVGNQLVNTKSNAVMFGEGHDSSNASNGVAAFGAYSDLTADTLLAVGNGSGSTKRKNAFEIKRDGSAELKLKAPNGKLFKLGVDNDGNLITTEV